MEFRLSQKLVRVRLTRSIRVSAE